MKSIDKNTRLLMLYKQLHDGIPVNKIEFCVMCGINERSFDRDIEDIRLFLAETWYGEELIYDKQLHFYYLSGKRPKFIDRLHAIVMLDLLVQSKILRSDEMYGLIEEIKSQINPREIMSVQQALHDKLKGYTSGTKNAILKILENLYEILCEGIDIKISFISGAERIVSPLEIRYIDNQIFLISCRPMNYNDIYKDNVDTIKEFISAGTNYASVNKEKYFTRGKTYGKENS